MPEIAIARSGHPECTRSDFKRMVAPILKAHALSP